MPTRACRDRTYHCNACGKGFSTNSHLRRHEALHDGRISAVCPSCNKQFSRLDTARRHVKACFPDGIDTITTSSKRGKARQACDACAKRKLSCDAVLPCERCVSSRVSCSYQRRVDTPPISPIDVSTGDTGFSAVGRPAEEAIDANRGKIPIQFLLAFTAPAAHEATTTLVTANRRQSNEQAGASLSSSQVPPDTHFECYNTLFWDQENWMPDFVDYFGHDSLAGVDQSNYKPTGNEGNSSILLRLAQLCSDLASAQANLVADAPNSRIILEEGITELVFTTTNLKLFVQTYFQQLHQYYPFLHRPSFDCETVSLPLLLAIFLFGSLCSAPSDSTLLARDFFDVAEEYIFSHPTLRKLHQGHGKSILSDECIEILQAALLIEIVQNGTNNVVTRRRLRVNRHPLFIASLRSCGLLEAACESQAINPDITRQSDWQSFISKEIRTRLIFWAFVMDSCFAMMFNSCPLLTISELVGDVPCHEQIFEAETEIDYEDLIRFYSPGLTRQSPSQLFRDLLEDTWDIGTHRHITAPNLMITICALQSLLMTSRYHFITRVMKNTILRAADRWEDLWYTATERNTSELQPLQGFIKQSGGLCWFVRILVHSGHLEASDCRYAQIMPTDNIKDLHDFLRRYSEM